MADPWAEFSPQAAPQAGADPWAEFVQTAPATIGEKAIDAYKGLGTGAIKGTLSLGGMVGDLTDLGAQGLEKASNAVSGALGIEPYKRPETPSVLNAIPTSESLTNQLTGALGPLYQPKTEYGKAAETVGQFVPGAIVTGITGGGSLAGNIAQAGGNIARYAVLPGAATYAAEKAISPENKYKPYLVAGAGLAGGMVNPSRLITPNPIGAERAAQIAALPEGVQRNLTAGQRTGNEFLKNQESMAAVTPGAGGSVAERNANVQKSFTQAALAHVGENADNVRPEVIDRAFTRIGANFDAASANNTAVLDKTFGNDLVKAEHEYNSLTNPSQRVPIIGEVAKDIADKAAAQGGVLSGEQYQAMRSDLARKARASSDPQVSGALRDYTEALDDAMARSIAKNNPSDIGRFEEARRQYRNMLVIEKAAGAAGADGQISPRALASATKVVQGRRAYVRGQGDFSDLAHAGEEILKPLPNSGTTQRAYVSNALGALGAGAGLFHGGAAEGAGGALMGHYAGKMLDATANALINRAILSKPGQSALANQLMGDATPKNSAARNLLLIKALQKQSGITIRPNPPEETK